MYPDDLSAFHKTYQTETRTLKIHGRQFHFLVPAKIDAFIDPDNVLRGFPLWAKIWEPSWILAEYAAKTPAAEMKRILEIGSGIGVVGVVAAAFGHDVTMTEYDAHALRFAAANAHINNCPQIRIFPLDWSRPDLADKFDTILGSEVLYHERDVASLQNLFLTYLKPEGRIILASGVRRGALAGIRRLQESLDVRVKKFSIRSEDGQIPALLCHMVPKATSGDV